MTRSIHRHWLASALAALLFVACRDGTAPLPTQRSADQLHFVRPAPGAPALADSVASFWAVRGEDRELQMFYPPPPGSTEGQEFLIFKVPAAALAQRPDGSSIAVGDSVLITVRVVDPSRLILDFQPSGLRFSADSPARLRIELAETDSDLNGDGVVDSRDEELKTQLSLWRQEAPGQSWYKVASSVFSDLNEVEGDILGFSGYALAY